MNAKEKELYHQIHPLKLLADWSTAIIGLFLLWQHMLITGILVMIIPPPVTSFCVMHFGDIEKYRQTAFGRYLLRHMTGAFQTERIIGFMVMMLACWYHWPGTVALGLIVVLVTWFKGK